MPQALDDLAITLLEGIGDSMGPLYGSFSVAFAETLKDAESPSHESFGQALDAVQEVGGAQVRDKSLVDILVPAREVYQAAVDADEGFGAALDAMVTAKQGQESTRHLQARIASAGPVDWASAPPV